MKRKFFLESFKHHGLEYKIQDCSVSIHVHIYSMHYLCMPITGLQVSDIYMHNQEFVL